MSLKRFSKAQGSLEYLLLIGGAVAIVVVVIVMLIGTSEEIAGSIWDIYLGIPTGDERPPTGEELSCDSPPCSVQLKLTKWRACYKERELSLFSDAAAGKYVFYTSTDNGREGSVNEGLGPDHAGILKFSMVTDDGKTFPRNPDVVFEAKLAMNNYSNYSDGGADYYRNISSLYFFKTSAGERDRLECGNYSDGVPNGVPDARGGDLRVVVDIASPGEAGLKEFDITDLVKDAVGAGETELILFVMGDVPSEAAAQSANRKWQITEAGAVPSITLEVTYAAG